MKLNSDINVYSMEDFVNRIPLSDQDEDSVFTDSKSQQVQKQDGSEVRMFIRTDAEEGEVRF